MNLQEQLDYLYGLGRYGMKPGLDVISKILAELGNPHEDLKVIHIGGTNGKGSTAAMIDSVLRAAGVRTGLYTSPHIYRFNERVRIAGIEITDTELGALIAEVQMAVERAAVQPTFFEFTTAVALLRFARSNVDIAVVEVGVGGLLDATNVVQPIVSVITNIGLDHTHILGETRQEIAAKKAGIIKSGIPLVTAEQDEELRKQLARVCVERGSEFISVDQVVEVIERGTKDNMQHFALTGRSRADQRLNLGKGARELTVPLLGRHQLRNAATAFAVIEELQKQGMEVPEPAIREGFKNVVWEGRVDLVSRHPYVLVDGAHNPESMEALRDHIVHPSAGMPSRDVLVCSLKSGKDTHLLTDTLVPLFNHVIACEGVHEPMKAAELAVGLAHHHSSVEAIPDAVEATKKALKLAGSDGGVLIAGSLYMIPEALAYLRQRQPIGPLIP